MKIVKQPFFLIGVGSLLCAIILAVVSTLINPSCAVIKKMEKAMNRWDSELYAECMQSGETFLTGFDDYLYDFYGSEMNFKYLYLIGDAEEGEMEGTKEVPVVVVTKMGNQITSLYGDSITTIEENGKEYIYTGLE